MAHSEAYDRHPEHTLVFDEARVRLRVRLEGQLIADTIRGLKLREGNYPPVVYVPREDVRMEWLERGPQSTHCPFKGDACYFDFRGDGVTPVAQVAWSYETPFDQMRPIANHLAFYPDRVQLEYVED